MGSVDDWPMIVRWIFEMVERTLPVKTTRIVNLVFIEVMNNPSNRRFDGRGNDY